MRPPSSSKPRSPTTDAIQLQGRRTRRRRSCRARRPRQGWRRRVGDCCAGRRRTARRPPRPARRPPWSSSALAGGRARVGSWGDPVAGNRVGDTSATRRRHVGPAEGAHLAPPVFRSAAAVWQALRDRDIRGQVAAPARFSGPTAGEKCDHWRGATPASGRGRVPNRLSSGHRTLVGLESTPLGRWTTVPGKSTDNRSSFCPSTDNSGRQCGSPAPDEVSRDSLFPFRRIAIPC